MSKQAKQWVLCVWLLLILVGCTGGGSTPPLINLEAGGTTVAGFQSSYCWSPRIGPALCVDTIEPYFESSIALPAGDPIRLQLDAPLPDSVTLALSEEVFGDDIAIETLTPAQTVTWPVSVAPGTYVLAASGKWPQGDVTYYFSMTFE
jgi:hypothetical protein